MSKKMVSLVLILMFMASLYNACMYPTRTFENDSETESKDIEEVDEIVTLTFLYSSTDVNWMSTIEDLAENFMLENPSIKLEMEPSDEGIYSENLKIKEALGEFPDIFEIQNPYMFVEADMLGVIPEDVSDLVNDAIVINGDCYAVPLFSTTYGMIYNRLVFKKYQIDEPKNYDEFISVCKKIKRKGITPIAVGGSKSDYMSYWLNYFYQVDVVPDDPDWLWDKKYGKTSVLDDNVKTMFKHYQELFYSGFIHENYNNMNDSQIISDLIEEKVAMVYTGPWLFSQITEAYPDALISDKDNLGKEVEINDSVTFQLGWFFMPHANGDSVVINVRESNWAISSACAENPHKLDAAKKFLQYFYNIENYRKILQSMNALPTTKEAVLYSSDTVQRDLLIQYRYADVNDSYIGDYDTPEAVKTYLQQKLQILAEDRDDNTFDQFLEQLEDIWYDENEK